MRTITENLHTKSRIMFAICTLSLLTTLPLCAITLPKKLPFGLPNISFTPYAAIFAGEAQEYVYEYDKLLSELIWDMAPMPLLGLEAKAFWPRGLKLSIDGALALPGNTGYMADSDWMHSEKGPEGRKTDFSRHDAILQHGIHFSSEAGWIIHPKNIFLEFDIEPSIGFRYYNWKWKAVDGYSQYARDSSTLFWSPDLPKEPFDGTGITYLQEFWMPFAGIHLHSLLHNTVDLTISFLYSPFVSCYARDEHLLRIPILVFHDFMDNGYLFEPGIAIRWEAKKQIFVCLDAHLTKIGGLRGNTGVVAADSDYADWTYAENGEGSGAGLNVIKIRAGVEFQIR